MICDSCGDDFNRLRWVQGKGYFCKECAPEIEQIKNVPGSMFPYVTTHLGDNPHPIKVNSLRHLRKLEGKYGVQSVAFNYNQNNFDAPPRGR